MGNEKNKQSYGVTAQENIYEKYVGKFYISHPVGTNEQYVGKITEIDIKKRKITFNPYFGLAYNLKSRKNLYNLIDKDFEVFVDLTKISFEPTTEESILYNCYLSNKERIEKRKSESKNKRRRTKKQKSKQK